MAKKLNLHCCIKARNKVSGEEYVLSFHDSKERDDALAILREYGLDALLDGLGGFTQHRHHEGNFAVPLDKPVQLWYNT